MAQTKLVSRGGRGGGFGGGGFKYAFSLFFLLPSLVLLKNVPDINKTSSGVKGHGGGVGGFFFLYLLFFLKRKKLLYLQTK